MPDGATREELLLAISQARNENATSFTETHKRLDHINGRVRENEVRLGELHHVELELQRHGQNVHNLREGLNTIVGKLSGDLGALRGEFDARKDQQAAFVKDLAALESRHDKAFAELKLTLRQDATDARTAAQEVARRGIMLAAIFVAPITAAVSWALQLLWTVKH